MRQNGRRLWLARTLALLLAAGLAALVLYAPWVAAIFFIVLVSVLAIAEGKNEGCWGGVRLFVREILFGW
jgi:hypothetical protein